MPPWEQDFVLGAPIKGAKQGAFLAYDCGKD
jgi:hypothetical protein